MVGTAQSAPLPTLPRSKPLVESREIDETARVAALADLALAIKSLDGETDHPALHRDHPRRGPHQRADRRRAEVADIDLGTDRDPARFEIIVDGVGGRHFHFHDHHRRPEHRRHRRDDMPDGAIGRHRQGALGAHADLDDFACVHGMVLHITTSSRRTPEPIPRDVALGQEGRRLRKQSAPGVMGPRMRGDDPGQRYLLCAALRSTKVLPPFILWASGASLIWMTTASASTPRFFTSACVMSRIMPAFCSSVRPAAMLTVISGIVVAPFSLATSQPLRPRSSSLRCRAILHRCRHPRKRMIQHSAPFVFNFDVSAYWM